MAFLSVGDNLSGIEIDITAGPMKYSSYTPKTIFTTTTGAYLYEWVGNMDALGLTLHLPDNLELPVYTPGTDSIPWSFEMPSDVGVIVNLDKEAIFYEYLERGSGSHVYGFDDDFNHVDITQLTRTRVTRCGSDANNVRVGTVNCPTVADFFVLSDNGFYCDIKLTGSIKYTPGSGLMDSAEITIPIIPGWLEAGESIAARNISIVAREDNTSFEYVLIPYNIRYSNGAVSFYVKGYKPNESISGTAKTVATYISVHIAGLFISGS